MPLRARKSLRKRGICRASYSAANSPAGTTTALSTSNSSFIGAPVALKIARR